MAKKPVTRAAKKPVAKKANAKAKAAPALPNSYGTLPAGIKDEYEGPKDVRSVRCKVPNIVWVYTPTTMDVWKESKGVWEMTQSNKLPGATPAPAPEAPATDEDK